MKNTAAKNTNEIVGYEKEFEKKLRKLIKPKDVEK